MRELVIKGMSIGPGVPRTIVSLMGTHVGELLEQAERGRAAGADCFEYRADYAPDKHDTAALVETARTLTKALPENPVLFTFRTASQGGREDLTASELAHLCRTVIAAGAADLMDIESWLGDETVRSLCGEARRAGMASVVSFHDFSGTPSEGERVRLLVHFAELGASIPKIAVMARTAADVVSLLAATERASRKRDAAPVLTMAMGAQGSLTRLAGETFGSALTFCALDRASAPGQIPVAQAKRIMTELHEIATQ